MLAGLGISLAQSSSPQMIDVYFQSGNPDYLDLSGKKVLPTEVTAINLQSFVIGYSAWNLMGEFVHSPSFYYEIDRRVLRGKTRRIQFDVIKKYPDLAMRYKAIRPTSVNFTLRVELKLNYDTHLRPVKFRVTNNALHYFESRSGKNYKSPISPPRWQDAFSTDLSENAFTASDNSEERILVNLMSKQVAVVSSNKMQPNVVLDIKWPDDAIDEIGRLYDHYEKQDKKLDDELKAIKEANKPGKPIAAYDKADEMAAPFEEEAKSAEVFNEGERVGLRAKGRVVFQSVNYSSAEPLKGSDSIFAFSLRRGRGLHIYNAKGKQVSVDGHSDFYMIRDGERPGIYRLFVTQDKVFYATKENYFRYPAEDKGFFTQREFDKFVAEDKTPRRAPAGVKTGELVLVAGSKMNFSRGTLYTVDSKLRVLSRETVYY